jgi:hypothetical protein
VAPSLLVGQVAIPGTAQLNLVGAPPSLNRIAPPGATLGLVGVAPVIAASKVITPPTGQLVLVGSEPVLKNPNWVNIDDSQTPNWVLVAA